MLLKSVENKLSCGLLAVSVASGLIMETNPAISQQRACILTDSGQKICGKLLQFGSNNNPSTPAQSSVTLHGPNRDYDVNMKLIKCSRQSTTVNCKFSIVKTGGSRDGLTIVLKASGSSDENTIATDEQDREYVAKFIDGGGQTQASYIHRKLVNNQPIIASWSFEIPKEVKIIKRLMIPASHTFDDPEFRQTAYFANINISR
jgi:hypothetical protein